MIRKCKISGNDFLSNGEVICDLYLQAYKLGFEEGKKSVETTTAEAEAETETTTAETENDKM